MHAAIMLHIYFALFLSCCFLKIFWCEAFICANVHIHVVNLLVRLGNKQFLPQGRDCRMGHRRKLPPRYLALLKTLK